MNLLSLLLKAATLGFTAAAMPGSFQAYLINQAALHGWRRAAITSLAPLISDGPIVLLAVLALALVPAWVLPLLQIAGACFIFYLAYRALRALWCGRSESEAPKPPPGFLAAVTINLLNPNVYIYWSTVSGPIFMQSWRISPAWGLGFLAFFYGIMVLTSNGIILAVVGLQQAGKRVRYYLQVISTGLLAVMGIVQLAAGISGLV
jgi:threonine/homoserine/homoserine lactone efflux protein